jgi:hypothetical protein
LTCSLSLKPFYPACSLIYDKYHCSFENQEINSTID